MFVWSLKYAWFLCGFVDIELMLVGEIEIDLISLQTCFFAFVENDMILRSGSNGLLF